MSERGAYLGARETELLPFAHEELEGSLPERFARVATTWPSAVAIASGSGRITYRELAHRTDALATAIGREASAGEAPVAIVCTSPMPAFASIGA